MVRRKEGEWEDGWRVWRKEAWSGRRVYRDGWTPARHSWPSMRDLSLFLFLPELPLKADKSACALYHMYTYVYT